MSSNLVSALIIFAVSGLPFLVFGYLIAIKKRTSLIAGWDDRSVSDAESFANVFGWTGIFCGLFLLPSAYLFGANAISEGAFLTTLFVAVFLQLAAALFCKLRYSK